jgi:hypothetical protein
VRHTGHLGGDFGVPGHAVDRLAVVPVGVNAEQDLGFDLPETVEHALDPKVGRGGRPDRPERGGGEHRDQRLWHVRQIGGDAIPLADPGGLQGLRAARDLRVELAMREAAPELVFTPENQRVRVITAAQQVLGVVERACGNQRAPGIRSPFSSTVVPRSPSTRIRPIARSRKPRAVPPTSARGWRSPRSPPASGC